MRRQARCLLVGLVAGSLKAVEVGQVVSVAVATLVIVAKVVAVVVLRSALIVRDRKHGVGALEQAGILGLPVWIIRRSHGSIGRSGGGEGVGRGGLSGDDTKLLVAFLEFGGKATSVRPVTHTGKHWSDLLSQDCLVGVIGIFPLEVELNRIFCRKP